MSGKLTSVFVGHGLRVGHDLVGWYVANITVKPIKKPIATRDEKNATHFAGFKVCPSILNYRLIFTLEQHPPLCIRAASQRVRTSHCA
jgi:hypothetical protein